MNNKNEPIDAFHEQYEAMVDEDKHLSRKVLVSFVLSREAVEMLRKVAQSEGRSMTKQVEHLILKHGFDII